MGFCLKCGAHYNSNAGGKRRVAGPYCSITCRDQDIENHVEERRAKHKRQKDVQAAWAKQNAEHIAKQKAAKKAAKEAKKGQPFSTACTKPKPRTETEKAVACLNIRQHDRDTCIHYKGCSAKASRKNLPTVCTCDCPHFQQMTVDRLEALRAGFDPYRAARLN